MAKERHGMHIVEAAMNAAEGGIAEPVVRLLDRL
jgi:hypothetical protein